MSRMFHLSKLLFYWCHFKQITAIKCSLVELCRFDVGGRILFKLLLLGRVEVSFKDGGR